MFARVAMLCLVSCLWTVSPNGLMAQERGGGRPQPPEPDKAIDYKQVGDKSLKLHLFLPKAVADGGQAKTEANGADNELRSAIVFYFGGGWTSGSPSQFYAQARYLADRGMVAACADYRVYSRDKAQVIDCIADAQDALLYVRDHAAELRIDPKRIAAAGGSAGGHLAAAVATLKYRGEKADAGDRYRPNALVLFNPALVLAPVADGDSSANDGVRVANLQQRMGDKPEAVSPYHHLSQALPPTLIVHGKADTTVPYRTVEAFEKRAVEFGAKCTLVGYAGQAHGFFNFNRGTQYYEATRDEMTNFLTREGFLTKPTVAPRP